MLMVRIRNYDGTYYEGELYGLAYDVVRYNNGVKEILGYQVKLRDDYRDDVPVATFETVPPHNIEVFMKGDPPVFDLGEDDG